MYHKSLAGSRIERYFDLFITYSDGQYHTSSHATRQEAMDCLANARRKWQIDRALVWSCADRVSIARGCVHLGSTCIHKEGRTV